MKIILSILLLCSLTSEAQNICVSVDCKDTVKYPTVLTLNGNTSSSDGVKSRSWAVTKGTATINNSSVDSTFATTNADGLYIFQLTGTSNKGAIGIAFDSVIYVANKVPAAIVGPSVLSTDGTAILSGSNSTDPEGLPLQFSWTQLSGPTTAAIATPTMSNPIVSNMVNGTYVFTLKVVDPGGLSSTASQLVQVNMPKTIVKTVTVITTFYSDGTSTSVTTTVP